MSFELDVLKQILVEQKRTNDLLEQLISKENSKDEAKTKGKVNNK